MTDDEAIVLRKTVIGGKSYADDYTVIWRDLPIGRILRCSGLPSQAEQWWWGFFTFCNKPSVGTDSGTGTDLEDCKAKFKFVWATVRAELTDANIAEARRKTRPPLTLR